MCVYFFIYLFTYLFVHLLDLEPDGLKHPQASSSQVAKIFLLLHQPQASPAMPYEVS